MSGLEAVSPAHLSAKDFNSMNRSAAKCISEVIDKI
jgi:hypothetical protein